MNCDDNELNGGGEFVERVWKAMVRIAWIELDDKGCAAPDAHAEDVAGSVRMTLLKMWHELRSPMGAVYVFTARRARTHARKCRREAPGEINDNAVPFFSEPGMDPEERAERAEFWEWALSVVGKEEKEMLVMRYYDDLAFATIAEQLEKPIGTVTSMHTRALEKIRRAVSARQAATNAAPSNRTLESLKRRPS